MEAFEAETYGVRCLKSEPSKIMTVIKEK